MKKYAIEDIRNVIFVGHQASGKTTLAEAILFNAGVTNRMGRVEDGNTVMDSSPDEIERNISITTGLAYCEIDKAKVNILDTPGYEDFIGEVFSCLPVVEGSVVVVSADNSVEIGTEKAWEHLDRYNLPRIVCVNKMEKEHASFDKVLSDAQSKLSSNVMPLQIPIGEGESFKGVIDLLKKKAYIYSGTEGKFSEGDIPADMGAKVEEWRQKLLDFAAESDDSLLEKFLEGGELTDEELVKGIASGSAAGNVYPMVFTSAVSNMGVAQLMSMIVSMMPSPLWREDIEVRSASGEGAEKIKVGEGGNVLAFVYKALSEKHIGDLSFIKVFSGKINVGDDLYNSNLETNERIGQLYFIQGKNRLETDSIGAGDIGAAVKLKSSKINHTLCTRSKPIVLREIEFPVPMLNIAIQPKAKGDEEKIGTGLARLNDEDPTFNVKIDAELHQTLLSAQGELHVDVLLSKLKRKYGVQVETAQPKIPYRETITAKAEAQGKYKKQSGGRGQYGDVWLRLEPMPKGGGFEFVDAVVGGVVPSKYIPSVEKGVRSAMEEGVVAGYPVMDVKVTIYDGSFHPVDSSDNAFKIAGSMGFKNAAQKAKPVILEPIMNVEVIVPDEFMGDVMGDLSARRGKIQGMEQEGSLHKIKAQVPLAELYRYSTSLRSMTQGRAVHKEEFSNYEEVPHEVAQKLVTEAQAAKEEGN